VVGIHLCELITTCDVIEMIHQADHLILLLFYIFVKPFLRTFILITNINSITKNLLIRILNSAIGTLKCSDIN